MIPSWSVFALLCDLMSSVIDAKWGIASIRVESNWIVRVDAMLWLDSSMEGWLATWWSCWLVFNYLGLSCWHRWIGFVYDFAWLMSVGAELLSFVVNSLLSCASIWRELSTRWLQSHTCLFRYYLLEEPHLWHLSREQLGGVESILWGRHFLLSWARLLAGVQEVCVWVHVDLESYNG